ncbi:bacitracin resistance protein [Microbacterium sp. HJ5]
MNQRRTPTWVVVTISVVFGLFYAYALWNALAFLVAQAGGPLGLNGYGWFVLLLAVVFPLVAFAVAFALGWRRTAWQFALLLFAGLCVVAVFWLNVVAYAAVYGASLLG